MEEFIDYIKKLEIENDCSISDDLSDEQKLKILIGKSMDKYYLGYGILRENVVHCKWSSAKIQIKHDIKMLQSQINALKGIGKLITSRIPNE